MINSASTNAPPSLVSSVCLSQTAQLASQPNVSTNTAQISSNLMSFSTAVPQFESIRKWLIKNQKKYVENDQPSNKMLSQFLCQFIQFQEEYLGRYAATKPPIPVTRLPVSSFSHSSSSSFFSSSSSSSYNLYALNFIR